MSNYTANSINPQPPKALPQRIYLSRRNLTPHLHYDQFPINEAAVEQLFTSFRFTIIYPEQLESSQLTSLIHTANLIATATGSAFLPENGKKQIISLGIPPFPNAPAPNQPTSYFIPFSGAIINELHGTFVHHIPHLARHLEAILADAPIYQRKKKAIHYHIQVMGLHLSGCGAVAKALAQMGLFAGQIRRTSEDEAIDLWIHPEEEKLSQTQGAVTNGRDRLIEQFRSQADMSVSYTPSNWQAADFWAEGWENSKTIGVFAHPMSVALSLLAHWQIPLQDGFQQGLEFNRFLANRFNKEPFPLICADLPDDGWTRTLLKLIDEISKILPEPEKLKPKRAIDQFDGRRVKFRGYKAKEGESEADKDYHALLSLAGLTKAQHHSTGILLTEDEQALTLAVIENPANLELKILLANLHFESGDYQQAAEHYQAVLEHDNNRPKTAKKLALTYENLGKTTKAIAIYERLMRSEHASLDSVIRLAVLTRAEQRYTDVIELCSKGLRMNPAGQTHHLLTMLAEAKHRTRDTSGALEHYRQALSIDPERGFIHSPMGDIYRESQDFHTAAKHYRQAIAQGTSHVWVFIHLGHCLNQLGEFEQSRHILQQATVINPNLPPLYRTWGDSYRLDGNDREAASFYKQAFELDPNNFGTLINLGWTLIRLNDKTYAQEIIGRAAAIQPNNPHVIKAQQALSH